MPRDPLELWLAHPVFAAAGREAVSELATRCPARTVAPGEPLIETGDPPDWADALLSGTTRLFFRGPDGREVTPKLLLAPNLINDLEVIYGIPLLISAAAVDEVVAARIPAAEFLAFLEQHPAAAMGYVRHIAGAFLVATVSQRVPLATIEMRIASLLLSYADLYGEMGEEGVRLAQAPSQSEIAAHVAAVPRHVSRVLGAWRDQGLLLRQGRALLILQPHALERIAGPIRHGLCYQTGMPLNHLFLDPAPPGAEIELLTGPPRLRGQRVPIDRELLLGRQPPSQLQLPDETVCPIHCRVWKTGTRFWVEDLGSLNSTLVNGEPVKRAVLHDGDQLELGRTRLRFCLLPGRSPAA